MSDVTVISMFSEAQVARLTGLSVGQLRYWTKTDFFDPSIADDDRPSERVYSYRDLVALRVIAVLRKKHDVSLQHLRDIQEYLHSNDQTQWSSRSLHVLNKRIHIDEGDGPVDALSGQAVLAIVPLEPVISALGQRIGTLRHRSSTDVGQIEKVHGLARRQAVVAGTRIPVMAIREFYDAGYSVDSILCEYPSLEREDIDAALAASEAA